MASYDALEKAMQQRVGEYADAIDRLRELASDDAENEVYGLTSLLRESVELVRCLQRMARGRSLADIHAAFGAPGDWGYETPIGDALARAYRGEP